MLGILEITLLGIALFIFFVLFKGFSLSAKLIWNSLIGAIGLYIYNLLVVFVGFKPIAISIVNVLVVGFFGVPGLIALIIWQTIFKGSM